MFKYVAGLAAGLSFVMFAHAQAPQNLGLAEQGALTIAFSGDMPGTGYQDGDDRLRRRDSAARRRGVENQGQVRR
jgi:hypothetical protein